MADAEAAILRLNSEAAALANTEAIARLLLRAEAVASSEIEGLRVGPRRLLRAEAAREFKGAPQRRRHPKSSATSMLWRKASQPRIGATRSPSTPSSPFTLAFLGEVRSQSTQVGCEKSRTGSAAARTTLARPRSCHPRPSTSPSWSPTAAFCNDDSLPAVVQAAVAHAQFETIHPFVDGNGRTSRALIHLILRRRGVASRMVPPVSLILATLSTDYITGLTAYRYAGDPFRNPRWQE